MTYPIADRGEPGPAALEACGDCNRQYRCHPVDADELCVGWRRQFEQRQVPQPPAPARPYTVWLDHGMEGWHPSDPMSTLDECLRYANSMCASRFEITRRVDWAVVEKENT